MGAGLQQQLQRMFTHRPFREMVDTFVCKSRELGGTDGGEPGTLSGLDIGGIVEHLGFQIGTGKEGHTREQEVCQLLSYGSVQLNFADQYSLCPPFTVHEADRKPQVGGG